MFVGLLQCCRRAVNTGSENDCDLTHRSSQWRISPFIQELTLQIRTVNRDHFSFSICSDTIVLNLLFPWRERGVCERDHISFSGKCSLPYKNEIKPMLSWFFYILTINKKKRLLTVHCTCIYSLWSLSGKCQEKGQPWASHCWRFNIGLHVLVGSRWSKACTVTWRLVRG